VYNRDYEDAPEKIPFARPAIFVEFENYALQDLGGYMRGPVPFTLHIVQDIQGLQARKELTTQQTAYLKNLDYPSLVREVLHTASIGNVRLDMATNVQPDHNHKTLLVHRVRGVARVRVKPVLVPVQDPEVLTELTLTNQSQEIVGGGVITAMVATADAPCTFYLKGSYTGLTLTVLTDRTARITGTASVLVAAELIAIGTHSGIESERVDVAVEAAETKITISLTYDQLTQTIWQDLADAQGNGAMANGSPVPSVTFPAAIINYSSANLPAGINLNATTGVYSKGTYASIPSGANTCNIDWEVDAADPNYTGSGSVEITITKRTRWVIGDLVNRRDDLSLSAWDDEGYVTEVADGEISQVLAMDGVTVFSQGSTDRRPTFVKFKNGRLGIGWRGNNNSFGNTNAGRAALNAEWYLYGSGFLFSGAVFSDSATNFVQITSSHGAISIAMAVNGVTITFTGTADRTVTEDLFLRESYFVLKHKTGAHYLKVYTSDGLVLSLSSVTASVGNFANTLISISSTSNANQGGSRLGAFGEQHIIEQALTNDEETKALQHLQYNIGFTSTPPFV
jgi:hypothetical protein